MNADKKCFCGKDEENCVCRPMLARGTTGGFYGLGFLGAAIYYIQNAATFGAGVIGFLKAIVWPVFLVYHLLQYLAA